jgi:hypothetical protein
MLDWNNREIEVATSRGGVVAVADYSDNLIRTAEPWPPPPVVQKLYESRQSRAFDDEELSVLTGRTGIYSDLQSLNSEDAITWSYFGPLMFAPPRSRAAFLNWLTARLELDAPQSGACTIDLWRRVPHPDKSLPGGPELDVVLDGDGCVVFGECKWGSGEGRGQGLKGDKGQMQLRREFLAKYGQSIYSGRATVALAVTRGAALGNPESDLGATEAEISWSALAEYPDHPTGDEFSRYLAWKTDHTSALHGRQAS